MERYTMKELPVLERPYEKLEMLGPKGLSTAELLAIILKTGTKEETSVQLAQRVLNKCCSEDGYFSIRNISLKELMSIKGIGRVKAITLQAVFELANKINTQIRNKPIISDTQSAAEYLVRAFRNEKQEKLKILCLDTQGRLERDVTVLMGTSNRITGIEPHEIFRVPLEIGSKNIIISHNHPSGLPIPSKADIEVTKEIYDWGKILKINIMDHIVVGDNKFVSIRGIKSFDWKTEEFI